MIRSVFFFCFFLSEVPVLRFLALHTKRKRYCQMGPNPCYLQNQVESVCQSFRPVAQSFFLTKVQFFSCFFVLFFYYRNGCGHIDILMMFPR